MQTTLTAAELGMSAGYWSATNLWTRTTSEVKDGVIQADVEGNDVVMLRLSRGH